MALERGLEGRDQLLKLVKRHAREIQELHRTGLQLGEPYTCHGSCLLSLYCDVRGASYQKESGINSYGCVVTATTCVMAFLALGGAVGVGVFVLPMSEEFGWNRGTN